MFSHDYVNETKCPTEDDPVIFFYPKLFSRKLEITVVISEDVARIYIRWQLPREKIRNNCARQKSGNGNGYATWKAPIICPCFTYLRDVAKALRFSSRRPESRNFFREMRALLPAQALSRNNAVVVWILYRAKMHFPRRVI